MTLERLRNIIEYSKLHKQDLRNDINVFCHQNGIENLDGVRNVLEIVRVALQKKNYLIINIPLNDDEIGAFVYRGDAVSYLVINTSTPILNTNFALFHELYHIYFPTEKSDSKARIDLDYYSNDEDEIRANLFAGNLLMPEVEFKQMFAKLKLENKENELNIIISMMNYFKAPFMAVYIRCYELELMNATPEYLDIHQEKIESMFSDLWFDTSVLRPSKIDNSKDLLKLIELKGKDCISHGYINSRTLEKVKDNVQSLFSKLKAGE